MEFSMPMVEMFFMISGFVTYLAYGPKLRETRESGLITVFRFVVSRIKRLYPLMIISILLMLAIQLICQARFGYLAVSNDHPERLEFASVLLSVLGLSAGWISNHDEISINGGTWYMCVLMICYCLFALVSVIGNRIQHEKRYLEKLMWLILFLLGFVLMILKPELPLLYECCGQGYMNFFLGVLLCYVYEKLDSKKRLMWAGLGLVLIVLFFVQYIIGFVRNNVQFDLFLNLGWLLLFLGVDIFNKIGDLGVIKSISAISFELYLFNQPAIALFRLLGFQLTRDINSASAYAWMSFVVINLVMAILFHNLNKLIQRYIGKAKCWYEKEIIKE